MPTATSYSSGLTQVDERKLYQIIDFILNHAESHELDVIRAALRRREGGDPVEGGASFGQEIGKMANDMAAKVRDQVGASESQIRDTVRGFVRDMIEREAPELRGAQVDELLDEWVPGPETRARKKSSPGEGIPADVVLTMVRQFIAFSTGAMTVAEENSLKDAMPEWQNRYWSRFSPTMRKLISLFVKGIMSEHDFWAGVYDELGLDASGSDAGGSGSSGPPSPS